jgi:hypothetical protein
MSFNTQALLKGRGYVLMIKFGKAEKIGLSSLLNRSIRFWQFQSQIKEGAKLEDPKCFEARKGTKRHQGTKIEENQARSRSRKNQTIWFATLDYLGFLD